MKKIHILGAVAVLSLLASAAPAAALTLDAAINGNASAVSSDDQHESNGSINANAHANASASSSRESEKKETENNRGDNEARGMMGIGVVASMMNRWKEWDFDNGIAGTVTAVNGTTVTVQGTNGTVYTVNTANAHIRSANDTAITTGDHVYVQGVVNGTTVSAMMVIDGKATAPAPTADDKRTAIVGTVTAKSGTTLTVLSKNGKTYTIDASGATVWEGKDTTASVSNIAVGDAVVAQGTVNGSSVTATKIFSITLPAASANGGMSGTVTAVSDHTLTLLVAGGTTYSVDTTTADFKDRKGSDEDVSAIHVGDRVTVDGAVSGSTITATSVSDTRPRGFFWGIGNFFKHLFGRKNAE